MATIQSDPQVSADQIAKVALSHYDTDWPEKGKPKPASEWTVFAAIVASNTDMWVVSSATGTKCCCIPAQCQHNSASLCILRDSHAEVLARRGLIRVLALEMQSSCVSSSCTTATTTNPCKVAESHRLLERGPVPEEGKSRPTFQLKPSISLHLYVSDSPCGDASIYRVHKDSAANGTDDSNQANSQPQHQFTSAKIIVSAQTQVSVGDCGEVVWRSGQPATAGACLAREPSEQWIGKLRSKAGRSNVHLRSRSMSCSDKLVRWSIFGLQGSLLLNNNLQAPIRLSTLVISRDPMADICSDGDSQHSAARRIAERVEAAKQCLVQDDGETECLAFCQAITAPAVFISKHTFVSGKSAGRKTVGQKRKREGHSPAGFCVNWQHTTCSSTEVTVGARGIRQGKKPRSPGDYEHLHSRLSRKALLDLLVPDSSLPQSTREYADYKRQQKGLSFYASLRDRVFRKGPLAGWLIGDDMNQTHVSQTATTKDSTGTVAKEAHSDHDRSDKYELRPEE